MAAVLHESDQEPAVTPYVATTVIALLLASLVTVLVLGLPAISRWDAWLSLQMQGIRQPDIDRLALSLTLAGDFLVGAGVMTAITLSFVAARQWWLALYLPCVFLSANLLVALLKGLLMRSRPELSGSLLSDYSFPSGHSCTAVVLFGTVALVLASELTRFKQLFIYTLAAVLAFALGLSRIYLLAHWPSDVLAGFAIGLALLVPFAWQLALNPIAFSSTHRYLLLMVTVSIYCLYCWFFLSEQAVRYAISL